MAKILDLGVFRSARFDVKLLDGRTIHLNKPTQRMVITIAALKDIAEWDLTKEEALEELDNVVLMILNNNRDNLQFNKEFVEKEMVIDEDRATLKLALVSAYTDFIREMQSDPN